jgi:BirA family transcriptional regulator, biotin operon repressor / biotin---[acetyl-CoA-carboxylase] ligase
MAPHTLGALQAAADRLWPGLTVQCLPEIDSTNSELMRRLRQGHLAATLLLADVQTAGRGRMGRQWHGQAGDALTFSLALPYAPQHWQGLSLAVGVAVAQGLHPDVRLKWPNDLFLRGGKLGGILVETSLQTGSVPHVVVGIGINLRAPDLPDAPYPLASLRSVLPQADPAQVLLQLLPRLMPTLRDFESHGFAPWQAAYAERDLLLQREVQLSDGRTGTAMGCAADGALRVLLGTGQNVVINSGEVSVRVQHH